MGKVETETPRTPRSRGVAVALLRPAVAVTTQQPYLTLAFVSSADDQSSAAPLSPLIPAVVNKKIILKSGIHANSNRPSLAASPYHYRRLTGRSALQDLRMAAEVCCRNLLRPPCRQSVDVARPSQGVA
jgi:hypothetical protein